MLRWQARIRAGIMKEGLRFPVAVQLGEVCFIWLLVRFTPFYVILVGKTRNTRPRFYSEF